MIVMHNSLREERLNKKKDDCSKCSENRASLKCAGPYVLGPVAGYSPVKCIKQCIGRRMATQNFVLLKLLTMKNNEDEDTRQGKMLLHNEYTLLSMLRDQTGVANVQNLLEEEVVAPLQDDAVPFIVDNKVKTCKRLCLALDCYVHHEYDDLSCVYINLQDYLMKYGKLREKEALLILFNIINTVNRLHKVSFL